LLAFSLTLSLLPKPEIAIIAILLVRLPAKVADVWAKNMNEEITYTWSEKLGRDAMLAAHSAQQARLWFMATGGFILAITGWIAYRSTKDFICIFAGLFRLMLIISSARVYLYYRRIAKDAGNMVNDPKVTVLLTDANMTVMSDQSTRTLEWSKISTVRDQNGFLLLYSGRILVYCLPKQFFHDSQIESIKLKVKK